MATAGYSGTPMAKKLGIKQGFIIRLINKPDYYFDLFTDLPADLTAADEIAVGVDFVHFFTKSQSDLIKTLPVLKGQIKKNGIIWVSWPKKASKVATDVRDDIIRNYALQLGLVDIKVCAVDEVWSGLKLVIPLADRMRR
ncbi:hypothetical protein A0256_18935 [Mucilaginibacter sp. PAMC 26640]|nr:hypothetical protein A0256_18935 [Mucilaginibacter sp. PAMC 26640]